MRTAIFWVITQQVAIISYPRFRTTYRFHSHGSRIQYSRRNNPKERSSQLLRGGNLKSYMLQWN